MNKVCEVYLGNSVGSDDYGVYLTLPTHPFELTDALEQVHAEKPGYIYWQVDEFYHCDFLAPHLDENMSIFEFDALTEQLSKLDAWQETALDGLLRMQEQKHIEENSGVITAQELLTLAYNTECCQVLADVHADEELGRFYVENGFREDLDALPERVYELLDYAKIGRQMREAEKGVFTPRGYVIQMDELKPLPDVQPQQEPVYMIRLTLMNHETEQETAVLDLPATEEQIQDCLCQLHIPDWSNAKIVDADAIASQLNTLLTGAEDFLRVNTLAQSLQELKIVGQLPKFKAVILATDCETLDDVFDRMEKLSQYCFEAKIRDIDKLVRDELEFVLGGNDAELIYRNLNRDVYANEILKQYGAKLTPYGMVNRADFGPLHEPISEQQQEQTQEPQMGM